MRDYEGAPAARSCTRKRAYPAEAIAAAVARRIDAAQGAHVVHAYGCTHCGAWHIGAIPDAPRIAEADRIRPAPPRWVRSEHRRWLRTHGRGR